MLLGSLFAGRFSLAQGVSDMDVFLKLECSVDKGVARVRYALKNQGRVPVLAYDGAPGVPSDALSGARSAL